MYARGPQAMAHFVLKIEKLSHIIGTAPVLKMARAYRHPRLWLLFFYNLESGLKNIWIRCRISRMSVDGSRIRKENLSCGFKKYPDMCGWGLREPSTPLCHPISRTNHETTEHFLRGAFFAVYGHLLRVTIGPLDCHCDWLNDYSGFHLFIINFSRQSVETELIC